MRIKYKFHGNICKLLIIIVLFSCTKKYDEHKYKIFRYNQDAPITSLDPAFAKNQGNIWAVTQLYNGLVELNNKMEVIPSLAETWEITPDGKTYTFKLRKGLKFHDAECFKDGKGREVMAKDFVFSFRRIVDKKIASSGAWIFNDKILKLNDSTFSDTAFIALDDYTFRINLHKAYPPFIQILSMPYAYVVPEEGIQMWDKEFRNHPVGTGPFKLKIWEESNALIFSRNENYWKKDEEGKQLPYIDGVHISFIGERNLAFMTFMQKKIDFISGLDENSRDVIFNADGTINKEFSQKYNVQKLPYANTEYLGFLLDSVLIKNKNHPILNKKVRQALNYAINKEQMVRYILSNVGVAGNNGIIPPCLLISDIPKVKGYEYNLVKAQTLLKEAGFPGGKGMPPIKLNTIVRFPYKEIAEFIQREWAKVGVKLIIETTDYPTLLELMSNSRIEFFRASWFADYPDPENFLSILYGKNFSPAGSNRTHYHNKDFDALYNASLSELDEKKRFAIYRQMDQIATNDAPMIILFYDEVTRLTQKNISGLNANPMNVIVLERVDIKN